MPGYGYRMAVLSVHSSPLGNMGEKDTGGMSAYLQEVSCELGMLGFSLDIFTRSTTSENSGKVELIAPGVRLIHLKAGPQYKLDKEKISRNAAEFVRQLQDFKEAHGIYYDIIFSHYWISGIVGNELQKSWQVPHIIMFHTLGAVKSALKSGEREPVSRLKSEKFLAVESSHIIVSSEMEKKEILFHYQVSPQKVSVIPCGVNLNIFRPMDKNRAREKTGLNVQGKIALFVGRLDTIKGVKQLLKALVYLKYRLPLRLVIVGGNRENDLEMKQLINYCCGLPHDIPVDFWGAVDQQELPYYYNAADFLVLPSYYESFGLVALEAMACGTPVLATDVGDLRKIIEEGKTGYVIPRNDPENIAEKMDLILDNSLTFDSYHVRESVSNYSWSSAAEMLAKKCKEVLFVYSSKRSG